MKKIPLTQGKFALVDDEDYNELSKHKWLAAKCCNKLYARRAIWIKGGNRSVWMSMHTQLLNPPPGYECDHINGDGLDNRRANLRIATRAQNQQNRLKKTGTTSRYKGVSLTPDGTKWTAHIRWTADGIERQKRLGAFLSEEYAARIYDSAATILFKEFARLNFPGEPLLPIVLPKF